jgi:hypothetical protein
MICLQRRHAESSLIGGRGVENAIVRLGRLGVRRMAHVVVMAHGTRLLTAALYADEYLVVQIKGTIG